MIPLIHLLFFLAHMNYFILGVSVCEWKMMSV